MDRFRNLFFVLIGLFFHLNVFAGEDDGFSTYYYSRIPGCGCFSHCTCFKGYLNSYDGKTWVLISDGFPVEETDHEKEDPANKTWHDFFRVILLAKKVGTIACDGSCVQNNLGCSFNCEDLVHLSEYLNAIQKFKNGLDEERLRRIRLYKRYDKGEELSRNINKANSEFEKACSLLDEIPDKLINNYIRIIEKCPHSMTSDGVINLTKIYNMGMLSLLGYNSNEVVPRMKEIIQAAKNHEKYFDLNFYDTIGDFYFEVGLYHDTIIALNKAIEKNPKNADAYFKRAEAYFEIGDFDQSISDFITSNKQFKGETYPKVSDEFTLGLISGMADGMNENLHSIVPSLLDAGSVLSKITWCLLTNPEEELKVFAENCSYVAKHSVDYFNKLDWSNVEEACIEKYKTLCTNFDKMSDLEKGNMFGSIIGEYGIDCILCGGTAKAVASLKNLKNLNRYNTLKKISESPKNKEFITSIASSQMKKKEKFFQSV